MKYVIAIGAGELAAALQLLFAPTDDTLAPDRRQTGSA